MTQLDTTQQMLIEQRVTNDAPSTGTAYLLLLFLGFFSAHRFYLGRPGSAVAQLLLNFLIIGLIWVFIDLFLIPGMIRDTKNTIRRNLTLDMMAKGYAPV